MAVADPARRLDYLNDAAHLLVTTAPETSAYLMWKRNSLMFDHGVSQSDAHRQHVCGSCGHIMIPGQGSTLQMKTARAVRKRHPRSRRKPPGPRQMTTSPSDRSAQRTPEVMEESGTTQKRVNCGMCGRYTKIDIPAAPPNSRLKRTIKTSSQTSQPGGHVSPTEKPAKVAANASSKKRAKSRKQGLQALLQQSQAPNPRAGFGLNLADFLKK